MKQRESAKLKESARSAKPEPRGHYQSRHFQNRLVFFFVFFVFSIDSFEQNMA